jgi:cell division protein FtsW (lipid II flippase)
MRTTRAITWARLRVYFGSLLLVLFALGALLVYASSLADQQSGHARSDLRTLGAALIALSVIAAVVAGVLKRRLLQDE